MRFLFFYRAFLLLLIILIKSEPLFLCYDDKSCFQIFFNLVLIKKKVNKISQKKRHTFCMALNFYFILK